MILLVDSGSTKTDYTLLDSKEKKIALSFHSMGFNPFFHSSSIIIDALKGNKELIAYKNQITTVYYFGAGCSSDQLKKIVSKAFEEVFQNATISIEHDMKGAAIATCGSKKGIVCILGTGSNSCYFDGENTKEIIPSLGYILGDEGSGAYLGKLLLTAYLYNNFPKRLEQAFKKQYRYTKKELIQEVLNHPNKNVFLASFATFMSAHISDTFILNIVEKGLTDFITIHVKCFDNYKAVNTHFIGSIAYYFKPILLKACAENQITVGNVYQKPMEGMVIHFSA